MFDQRDHSKLTALAQAAAAAAAAAAPAPAPAAPAAAATAHLGGEESAIGSPRALRTLSHEMCKFEEV
jgi:hypothetical protein